MASKISIEKAPEGTKKKHQARSDASTRSPYSSTYSSDTEDLPIRGLSHSPSISIKAVEELRIKEEEDGSSLDGTSIDGLHTTEISRDTSFDDRQALGSPGSSLSPSTSIFTFSAPGQSSQHAEKLEQRLKLARLLLTRGKVGVLHFSPEQASSVPLKPPHVCRGTI